MIVLPVSAETRILRFHKMRIRSCLIATLIKSAVAIVSVELTDIIC